MIKVIIHTGSLSVDNGAHGPTSFYFNLAKAIGVDATTGAHYYDDSLEINDPDWPTVEQLLIENKMLYKVKGLHEKWQNVQTSAVRRRLEIQGFNQLHHTKMIL